MEPALLTIFVTHWEEFAVRWLHVITAIAWIGSSFYFIALDLGLRKSDNLLAGTAGEEWQVHGGGGGRCKSGYKGQHDQWRPQFRMD